MSDDIEAKARASAIAKTNELSAKFDEEPADSAKADESKPDSNVNSDDDSDEVPAKVETKSDDETDFSFRETPTNIANFVAKLEKLSEDERIAKIESLDPARNKKEIEAARIKFPELREDKVTVSREQFAALQKKIDSLEELSKTEGIVQMMKTLHSEKPVLEEQLAQRMLRDKFGTKADEVFNDKSFKEAFTKFASLDIADRLEESCYRSELARKVLIEAEARKQNKQKALAGHKSGKTGASDEVTVTGKELITGDGIMKKFGKRLEAWG